MWCAQRLPVVLLNGAVVIESHLNFSSIMLYSALKTPKQVDGTMKGSSARFINHRCAHCFQCFAASLHKNCFCQAIFDLSLF
jgi:hypothetical protein